jgi:hypothetical protein
MPHCAVALQMLIRHRPNSSFTFKGKTMNVRQIGGTRRQPRNTSARLIMSDYLPNTVQLPANFLAWL